jgi:hypothetical protein
VTFFSISLKKIEKAQEQERYTRVAEENVTNVTNVIFGPLSS